MKVLAKCMAGLVVFGGHWVNSAQELDDMAY